MRKPPKNTQCDMIFTSYVEDKHGKLEALLKRCPNLATVTVKSIPGEAWICQECYDIKYPKEK